MYVTRMIQYSGKVSRMEHVLNIYSVLMYVLFEYVLEFLQGINQDVDIHNTFSVTACATLFCGGVGPVCIAYIAYRFTYVTNSVCESHSRTAYVQVSFVRVVSDNERVILVVFRKGVIPVYIVPLCFVYTHTRTCTY